MKNTNIQALINALTNAGYIAEETTQTRNGIERPAVSVRPVGDSIGIIIAIREDETPESILATVQKALGNRPDITINNLTNAKYLLENAYIAVQAVGTFEKGVLTRTLDRFGDIAACVKVAVDSVGAIKVKADILKKSGLDFETLWNRAIENTAKDVIVRDLGGVVHELNTALPDEDTNILVATNGRMLDGAGIIACDEVIEKAKAMVGGKMFMLPSSRHEVLFVPENMGEIEQLNEMVHAVNETQVEPEDRLTDHAYIIK